MYLVTVRIQTVDMMIRKRYTFNDSDKAYHVASGLYKRYKDKIAIRVGIITNGTCKSEVTIEQIKTEIGIILELVMLFNNRNDSNSFDLQRINREN